MSTLSPAKFTRAHSLGIFVFALYASACSAPSANKTGSQTNWLKACAKDTECGELECLCGVCSLTCDSATECSELPGSSCVATTDPGVVAVCGGAAPDHAMCLPTCTQSGCADGASCLAGVCDAVHSPDVEVDVDTAKQYQSLIGFGASLGFNENDIVNAAQDSTLYDTLFVDSGLDIVRIRNDFNGDGADNLLAAAEIVAAAAERLGHAPTVLMTEGSPPASLKANAKRSCGGDTDVCTLAGSDDGSFAYAEFADHWRASLDAYAAAGISPEYLSLQNNPDWSPPASEAKEACRFLPEEGMQMVELEDGSTVTAPYPGYSEALAAVRAAVSQDHPTVGFMAPEVGSPQQVNNYVSRLDSATYDAVAFHLYTTNPNAIDPAVFRDVGQVAEAAQRPLLQTEMRADGIGTALLTHYTLVEAGAAAYLQNDLVVSGSNTDATALVALRSDGFETQGPYHALRHFAHFTDPGWKRVDAASDASEILSSAWLSPEADALSIVLVNSANETRHIQLSVPSAFEATDSTVSRTTFDGTERSANLGPLGTDGVVTLPGHAIVTVALGAQALERR